MEGHTVRKRPTRWKYTRMNTPLGTRLCGIRRTTIDRVNRFFWSFRFDWNPVLRSTTIKRLSQTRFSRNGGRGGRKAHVLKKIDDDIMYARGRRLGIWWKNVFYKWITRKQQKYTHDVHRGRIRKPLGTLRNDTITIIIIFIVVVAFRRNTSWRRDPKNLDRVRALNWIRADFLYTPNIRTCMRAYRNIIELNLG